MQDPDKKLAEGEDTQSELAGNTLPLPEHRKSSSPTRQTIEYKQDRPSDPVSNEHTALFGGPDAKDAAQSPNNPPVASVETIPGFRIIKELGRGAYGVVFKAVDERLDRLVAIKLPLLKDVELYEKYIVEARNAAKIESKGIVPVLQVGTTPAGQPFVVQKMIDGLTLDEILKAEGSFPVGKAVEVAYQLASAISCAHSAGLVHRDLKPANIIVDANGDPWIADFGLAVFEEEQQFRHGEVAGTPTYMAPEQLLGRADWLDGRADIWALGIILHVMLTGKPPFEAANFTKLKEQVLHRDPRPLNQRLPQIPMELDFVFRKCCAKAVSDRYSSAQQLADELQEFLRAWSEDPNANTAHRALRPPMLAQRRFMGQQTVREEMRSGESQAPGEKAAKGWPAIAAVSFVSIAVVVGGVMWSQRNRWLSPQVEPDEIVAESPPVQGEEEAATTKVARQLRVSHAGEGMHATIAEALSAAEPGATIFIAAGTYRENLVIKRDVELRGEGAIADVRILGVDASAIRLTASTNVKLSNLTIEAEGTDINTIEVQDGSLEMNRCSVNAKSFNCIIVRPKSQLRILGNCFFQSAMHPAIFADQATVLEIRSSDFVMKASSSLSKGSMGGVQLRRCGGIVSGCTFSGDPRATGIDWADTDERAVISECEFTGLMRAIAVMRCNQLQISGKSVNQIENCKYGIVVNECQGSIRQSAIFGSRSENSVGLKVMNSENLEVVDVRCIAMDVAFEVQGSQVRAERFSTKQSGEYGVLLHDDAGLVLQDSTVAESTQTGTYLINNSRLEMQNCTIVDNTLAGVWVDSQGDAFTAASCKFERNGVGLVLTAGNTRISGGEVANNRSIGALVRKPVPKTSEASDPEGAETPVLAPINLYANGVRFEAAPPEGGESAKGIFTAAIYFTAQGSYTLEDCELVDAAHKNKPLLAAGLVANQADGVTQVMQK